MTKISFYSVFDSEITKFACKLLEKCFQNSMKVFVKVPDEHLMIELDKTLWTFSQKAFIPHSMVTDKLHDESPIYISDKSFEGNREFLMFFMPELRSDENFLIDFITSNNLSLKNFTRIIVVFNGAMDSNIRNIYKIISEIKSSDVEVEYHVQNNDGKWS